MTTIAYRRGVLACEGRVHRDGTILTDRDRKIFRVRGRLVGIVGDAPGANRLLAWMRAGGSGRCPNVAGTQAIIVYQDGSIWDMDDGNDAVMVHEPYAIGSGRDFALGAMAHGASAVQAVRIAMKRDSQSGGRIRTLRLK